MLKLGVLDRQRFLADPPRDLPGYIYHRFSRDRISFRLLSQPTQTSPEDSRVFELLMLRVWLSNGTCRATFRRRFRNIDGILNDLIAERFDRGADLVVEDMAGSACLTSTEWAETLLPRFPHIRFVASDLVLFILEVEDSVEGTAFVLESDGSPLQYVRPPFVIRMQPPEPAGLIVNWLLAWSARKQLKKIRAWWPLPESWLRDDGDGFLEIDRYRIRKLPLIHPEAWDLAHRDGRFSIRQHSVFEVCNEPRHVIRTMNVFNRSYFTTTQLSAGVRSIVASLHIGGIWIVGRTVVEEPPVHHVSVFQKSACGGLDVIHRIGPGSEIEEIATRASNSPPDKLD
jgi:hypothetical protein